MIQKCLNCREGEQRPYSNFCSFECGREYINKEEVHGNLKGKTPQIEENDLEVEE